MFKNKRVAFIRSVLILLIVSGVSKLVTALGENRVLGIHDVALTFLTSRQLLFITAAIELSVVLYLLRQKVARNQLLILAWLATAFLSYRTALWLMGYNGPCACFGYAWEWLNLNSKQLDFIALLALGYMLIGTYVFVVHMVFEKEENP